MNAKQFFYEVSRLRALQKSYFQTRSPEALRASKRQEKTIDNEIARVNKLIQENTNPSLFHHETDK